jgi:hypothetical protein
VDRGPPEPIRRSQWGRDGQNGLHCAHRQLLAKLRGIHGGVSLNGGAAQRRQGALHLVLLLLAGLEQRESTARAAATTPFLLSSCCTAAAADTDANPSPSPAAAGFRVWEFTSAGFRV